MAVVIKDNLVYSDAGKVVHRIGTEAYFRKAVALTEDKPEHFEEVDEVPSDEVVKAREDKIAEIDAYDKSDAVNSFTLDGAAVWLDKDTRVGLMNSVTIEKAAGREETTLWFPIGGTPQKIVINVDKATQMLAALELYALACYNTTAAHIANVGNLTDEAEIEAYDYTTGYPDRLNLSTK